MVGFSVLLVLIGVECSDTCGFPPLPERVRFVILPVATGLAFGIEKVFNTEIGFVAAPKHFSEDILAYPEWTAMALLIVVLGITDFCLNMRGAQRCPVQIFLPAAFAFGTALQYLQSVFIFGELRSMSTHDIVLSVCGCAASLLGSILIQPTTVDQRTTVDARTGHKLIQPLDNQVELDCSAEGS
jgi:hypothetical protein